MKSTMYFKKYAKASGQDEAIKTSPRYTTSGVRTASPKDQLRAITCCMKTLAQPGIELIGMPSDLCYRHFFRAASSNCSFLEFAMPPVPTSAVARDGLLMAAVLELNPTLIASVLEMLLGGTGKSATQITREVTEIEQVILESLLRFILHDLRTSWEIVAKMEFSIESHETEPQLLQILAPSEAMRWRLAWKFRIGDISGTNKDIGIPSIIDEDAA